jgi:hypothetical protein
MAVSTRLASKRVKSIERNTHKATLIDYTSGFQQLP